MNRAPQRGRIAWKVLVVLLALGAYYQLMFMFRDLAGPVLLVFSLAPVVLAGWLLGMGSALLSGLLVYLINAALLAADPQLLANVAPPSWAMILAISLGTTAFLAGRLHELHLQLTARVQNADQLEQLVAEERGTNTALTDLSLALLEANTEERIANRVLAEAMRATRSQQGLIATLPSGADKALMLYHGPDGIKDHLPPQSSFAARIGRASVIWRPEIYNSPAGANGCEQQGERFLFVPGNDGRDSIGFLAVGSAVSEYSARHLELAEKQVLLFARSIQRLRVQQRLSYQSHHDALTELYNRTYFEEEIVRLERGRLTSLSLLMIDVDDLKITNDTLGHMAGDGLLRGVAKVLKEVFRAEDVVARVGGDEFAVLLPGVDAPAAALVVERIKEEIAKHNARSGEPRLSLSIGMATTDKGGKLRQALKQADERMYAEKLRANPLTKGI